jgi:hypothetical protein
MSVTGMGDPWSGAEKGREGPMTERGIPRLAVQRPCTTGPVSPFRIGDPRELGRAPLSPYATPPIDPEVLFSR